MHIFLDNFHQDGKYTARISNHQAELRRGKNVTDQKYLSITFLQTDYLNLDSSSGSGRNKERANIVHKRSLFVEVLTILQKNASKGYKRIRKKLVQLEICTNNGLNVHLEMFIDVDL